MGFWNRRKPQPINHAGPYRDTAVEIREAANELAGVPHHETQIDAAPAGTPCAGPGCGNRCDGTCHAVADAEGAFEGGREQGCRETLEALSRTIIVCPRRDKQVFEAIWGDIMRKFDIKVCTPAEARNMKMSLFLKTGFDPDAGDE